MKLSISDGVTERLSQYLAALGVHLWDSRQRASFAVYMFGLLSDIPHKSVESIAALFACGPEDADAIHQKLLQFLGDSSGRYSWGIAGPSFTTFQGKQGLWLFANRCATSGERSVRDAGFSIPH